MTTKAIQGKLWSTAPQYWALHFEPWFLPMYKKALEILELTDNICYWMRVVDQAFSVTWL